MALAVAMNEWLTVMTSSSASTPTARSARWSAVVQFETAQANGAPTNVANSRSKAATSGPCVSHPDESGRRIASNAACPSDGRATGIIGVRETAARSCTGHPFPLAAPPGDDFGEPFVEGHRGDEPDILRRATGVGDAPRDGIHFPGRTELRRERRVHRPQELFGALAQAHLGARGDVVDAIGRGRLRRQDVR